MTLSSTYAYIVLALGSFGIAAAGLAFLLMIVVDLYDGALTVKSKPLVKQAVKEVGYSIYSASSWFTEDPSTRIVLKLLGDALIDDGAFDADSLREAWRKERRA